jgi:hypothetical protein
MIKKAISLDVHPIPNKVVMDPLLMDLPAQGHIELCITKPDT